MPLLANVLLSTTRRSFNPATNASSAPVAHLIQVVAHIGPIKMTNYRALPDAALASSYQADVDTGTDIATGDYITAMTLLDGITPWPGDFNSTLGPLGNDPTSTWEVAFHVESSPGPLAHRTLYIARSTGKGSPYAV